MIYEIREYVPNSGREASVRARLGEARRFFDRHGIEVVLVLEPTDMRAHLTYVLRFKDTEARRLAWASFSGDGEWRSLKTASDMHGVLLREVKSRCFEDVSADMLSGAGRGSAQPDSRSPGQASSSRRDPIHPISTTMQPK